MRKALTLFLGIVLAAGICLAQESTASFVPANAASPQRLQKLQDLLNAQVAKQGEKATAATLKASVQEAFFAALPELSQTPSKPFIDEDVTLETAEKRLHDAARELYPEYTPEELVKESEKRFPLYRKGQRVSIRIRTNPRRTERFEGYYNGTHGGNIAIGPSNYRLADMVGIPGNDGPTGEIAKFDPAMNRQVRQEWREEYERTSTVERRNFTDEKKKEFEILQRTEDFLENEKRGYTFFQEQWLAPAELLNECADLAARVAHRSFSAQARQVLQLRADNLDAQVEMSALAANVAPKSSFPSADKELKQRAEDEARRADLKAKNERDAALAAERAEENARQDAIEAERRAQRDAQAQQDNEPQIETTQGISPTTYAIGAVAIVFIFLLIGWLRNASRKDGDNDEKVDVSDFYEGKGKLQKEFWDAANADPENFKYVAYLFPTMDAAQDALLGLSFITLDAHGNIISKKEGLRYGCYQHKNGAVAFIGSSKLNYAQWREASMTWPELPNASYFKVSKEPAASLPLPDLKSASAAHIEDLGVEDVKTETGEVNRVYRFRAPTKEEAIKFLSSVEVKEEGLVVRVTTADGEYGKDSNGVFTN